MRVAGAVAAGLLLSLLAAELVVRVVARRDESGQEWIGDLRLLPYRLPLEHIAATLALLEGGDTFLDYDPHLGWAPRPNARSVNGPFRVNGGGIRAEHEIASEAADGVVRVALFGDSFTFGDEVGPDETWGAFLERGLRARDVPAEVLNFGVNAYGMDQAFLRWQRDGRRYRPDVVIYGFQPENVLRNMNVFRPLYFAGTEVPLSKPRLVVRDGAIAVLNVPTIAPRDMIAALATLPEQPLLAHERFYAPWYEPRWWLHSKLAALLATLAVTRDEVLYEIDDEGEELATRLAADFAGDVQANGGAFLILHLPRKQDMLARRAGEAPWYAHLLHELRGRFALVDPEPAVPAIEDRLFAPRGHYAPELNRAVGEALVEPVLRAAGSRPKAGSIADGATSGPGDARLRGEPGLRH